MMTAVTTDEPIESPVTLRVNGAEHTRTLDHRTTLLDALREHLGLTGTKKGCDHGQCGACTVLVDGRRANACLLLAVTLDGAQITTIEGLAEWGASQARAPGEARRVGRGELHPLQAAFVERDALQCGYCTPGQICSAVAMLGEVEAGWPSAVSGDLAAAAELDAAQVRERMSGNLCRCGAYVNIIAAILDTAGSR
jgi:xanthine dehydrogenase YagT iron-sulfur-binding subunit